MRIRPSQKSPLWGFRPIDHSTLVEIFLWEGEDEQAWQEARTGECSRPLWLRLAERRQQAHPEEALSIYQREIEPLIEQGNQDAMVIMNFMYQGSKQLYELDDNTITIDDLLLKIRRLETSMLELGLDLDTDSFDPQMLDRFT